MEVASSTPAMSASPSSSSLAPPPATSSSQQRASPPASSSSISSKISSPAYRPGCKHLRCLPPSELKTMLKRYALGVRWGKKIRQGLVQNLELEEDEDEQQNRWGSSTQQKKLLPHPLCSACYATLHKPYLCLSCGYAGCFYGSSSSSSAAVSQGCITRHMTSTKGGHDYAIELHSGLLYCNQCQGAVHDPRFEAIYHRERARAAGIGGSSSRHPLLMDYTDNDAESSPAVTSLPQHPISSRVPRGIHNLGATCFLSVILQSFVHNPVLRNYFLSDRHNSDLCGHAAGGESCVACEMDRLFRDFFNHDAHPRTTLQPPAPSPWTPNSFLYTIWRAQAQEGSHELSQAGQQDSHELFISVLNALHTALTASGSDPKTRKGDVPRWRNENDRATTDNGANGSHEANGQHHHASGPSTGFASRLCDCLIHRTFAGVLQSDVRCLVCGYRSSTHDPVLDLSVDLKGPASTTFSGSDGGALFDDADPLDLLEGPASKKKKGPGGQAAAVLNGGAAMKKSNSKQGSLLPPTGSTSSPSRKVSPVGDLDGPPAQDLLHCLRRYCTSERLPPSSYSCPQCGPVEASKQLSLRRLPPVLCIQLKRFEHHLLGNSSKVEARVRFPLGLDVREFVTPSVLERGERARDGGRKGGGRRAKREGSAGGEDDEGERSAEDEEEDDDGASDDPLAIDDFLYSLFCVIVHEGTLNTGHYWCFAKWQDNWYRFNDAEAPRKVSVAEVVAQEKQVYQLVYVRRGLENVR